MKPETRTGRARPLVQSNQRRASAVLTGSRRLPLSVHLHRCVLCRRTWQARCPDADARGCAVVCRLCAATLSEVEHE